MWRPASLKGIEHFEGLFSYLLNRVGSSIFLRTLQSVFSPLRDESRAVCGGLGSFITLGSQY